MTVHKVCDELGGIRHESVGDGGDRSLIITYDPDVLPILKNVSDKKRD